MTIHLLVWLEYGSIRDQGCPSLSS
jgi:hypothetical protein